MVNGYKKGITPNPDVMCNKEIKFGIFLEKALQMGADYVATGHYIKIQKSKFKNQNDNLKFKIVYKLLQARDQNKDQSYFLWTLTQKQLKHCLFPIGDYLKSEVREIAKKDGLPTAEKKDSQGICFIGKVSFGDFLKQYIPEKKGDVLDISGKKIGEHKGAHFYTIGQRHGLGIGGSQKPCYVAEKNIKKNTIVIAEGDNNQTLSKKEIRLKDVNFISSITDYQLPITIFARVRYRQILAKAELYKIKNNYEIIFNNPQKFIASGQSAVFYLPADLVGRRRLQQPKAEALAKEDGKTGPAVAKAMAGKEMLGGGVIDKVS